MFMRKNFKKEEIKKISEKLLDKISKTKKRGKAKILALSGDLGSGKTTITGEIGRHLGIKSRIISPTFVIMKIYEINKSSKYYLFFKKLIHIDAYRFDEADEILKIGWQELQKDKNNLIIVEWPEKIAKHLDNDTYFAKLEHVDEDTRKIEF
jgi:tRNA threonylcarbamoyladenosine biosynthesis protein TsaE